MERDLSLTLKKFANTPQIKKSCYPYLSHLDTTKKEKQFPQSFFLLI